MTRLLLLLAFTILYSCVNHGQLNYITELPENLSENSGIVLYENNSVWLIEDSGNKNSIYQVDLKGNLIKTFEVKDSKNHDWEDLTKDEKGNLYIGDFGNNSNTRKNLTIYKLPNPEIEKGKKIDAVKISFSYPEQKDFPPKQNELLYDSEAFFHFNGHLYIFIKNRAKPFSGKVNIYKVPDTEGTYEAELVGSINTCTDWDTCKITSAAISPNNTTIALLGNGKIWTITDFKKDKFFKGKLTEIDLEIRSQLESICFKNNTTLLLSDESTKHQGGNLYSYTLN